MSEATNPDQQANAQDSSDLSDESLEAVSGGLSRYVGNPTLVNPVIKPVPEPRPGDPILIVNEPGIILE